MPGFVLQPGEGELVYSVIARYGAMIGQGEGRALMREFFDSSANVVPIDLPAGLERFAARSLATVDPVSLVQKHTMFPYLFRFAPQHQVDRAREWLLEGKGRRPARTGVTAALFALPDRLMLCSECLRADAGVGLSAWRREHHLPGVLVCPLHEVALRASRVTRKNRTGASAFVALTPEIARDAVPRVVGARERRHLLGFARDSARLLKMPGAGCDLPGIQHRLRDLLRDYRWSRAPSLIASAELAAAFARHSAVRSLMLAMDLQWTDAQIATALNRLLYRDEVAKHPLLVLIVLSVAGATLDDLLATTPHAREPDHRVPTIRARPSIRDDLPCGNLLCARHHGPVAPQLIANGISVPVRAHCAACGFTYHWGPSRPRAIAVVETSPSWDALLAEMVSDPAVSVRAASRRLGIAPVSVMRAARRMGLWRAEWKDRPKLRLRQATMPARLLAAHRAAWLAHMASDIAVPIKRLPQPAFAAYRWLMRHDREWMQENGRGGRWRVGSKMTSTQITG